MTSLVVANKTLMGMKRLRAHSTPDKILKNRVMVQISGMSNSEQVAEWELRGLLRRAVHQLEAMVGRGFLAIGTL
jgi:hypothetical protein